MVAEALRKLDGGGNAAVYVPTQKGSHTVIGETTSLLDRQLTAPGDAFIEYAGDFPEEQLSVYVTARRYGGLGQDTSFVEMLDRLTRICTDMVDNHVADNILRPLARAIATQ